MCKAIYIHMIIILEEFRIIVDQWTGKNTVTVDILFSYPTSHHPPVMIR